MATWEAEDSRVFFHPVYGGAVTAETRDFVSGFCDSVAVLLVESRDIRPSQQSRVLRLDRTLLISESVMELFPSMEAVLNHCCQPLLIRVTKRCCGTVQHEILQLIPRNQTHHPTEHRL